MVHVDEESAVLREVSSSQVYTLADHPGFTPGEVVVATLSSAAALEAVWTVDNADPYPLEVAASATPPAAGTRAAVADQPPGTLERLDRSWGELHAIAVPDAAAAVEDIVADPATKARAARLGAHRVVVRGADGIVGVRYRTD